jgi:regulator of PEP synthase PpsR (kinase-PPPase family)
MLMRAAPVRRRSTVMVLSDSTGNLSRHILTAVLTQFPQNSVSVRFENFIRTEARLKALLIEARQTKAIICHAIVSDKFKNRVNATASAAKLHCFDLTGGLVKFLEKATRLETTGKVDALHCVDEVCRKRIGAMEFTLSHDDGLGLDSINQADVVLVGVSRTSKTPTSILLAQQGYRAANVSLATGVEPPAQLFHVPNERVVGLTISADQLAMIRARRQAAWGMSQTDYGRPESISHEVAWSRTLFRERGWSTLDVTDQAVEETAAKVIELVGPLDHHESALTDVLPR